ncbi:helicase-related protein [Fontivita pretiosa]|uniref:helicase-related protein n=1 Tax=Fontivita pretiosa TaxID=2989684 RepID=UPI003D16E7AD
MARLEELTRGATVKGILADGLVTIIDVKWHGSDVVEATYKDASGRLASELLYRDRESSLDIVTQGAQFSFDGDGAQFRLASEARRISLAHLFDPLLAIHTSLIEPLPHQITGVYEAMLPRQPLRFLLADDPGAGKTIMAGLLIKELMIRGDLHRCLICCPGNLAEQWQDEMDTRFHLPFDIVGREAIEASRTGNPFAEKNLVISRLDLMSRNDDVIAKIEQTEWDLVVVDEAHKMHASFFGGEVKETKRYKLGRVLGRLARHLLLMTATPHNGKEEEFQLFLALLDADRFEGRFRDGVHVADVSDLMRRVTKEGLRKFDGTPLFPERRAYTVTYALSDLEAKLYAEVTQYVREEMNRAERLSAKGEGRRGSVVGFALTILQRRLASSPEAIYQSLRRRRERLEKRLREERLVKRGSSVTVDTTQELPAITPEDIEELDDAPDAEVEAAEEAVVDQASAAQTIAELEAEIRTLQRLEQLALQVRRGGTDRKWEELSNLLQNNSEMFDAHGHRRKLVIFTEHRDTLSYLADRLRALLGRPEAVVTIHGGMGREDRRKTQELFTQDKDVQILVATDAAGEGINLQRAHLMVNYDLPWNPNRLEQRFGRIHRIGQTEVCHLWNLVAHETREGEVYHRLLEKIEEQRKALGGRVFDVLGKLFLEKPLRELLIEAIRYGEQPEVRQRLFRIVDAALDREHLRQLLEERALAHESLDAATIRRIKEDMERAEARRLQPHFIASFFIEAFRLLGGTIREREPRRYEITHVPAVIRSRDRQIGTGRPVLSRYERVTFHKELISVPGKPLASFVCPGHPLLDATIDIVLERYRDLLRRGAVLVDPRETSDERVRMLFYIEHAIQDGRTDRQGNRRIVSRQLQFVEMDADGRARMAGYAPYLDYRPITDEERALVDSELTAPWLRQNVEETAVSYAIQHLVPKHFEEVKRFREEQVAKTAAAVKDRLTKEINYWDHRAAELQAQEQAGRVNARLNSAKARERANELEGRLRRRMDELEQERRLSPLPPVVVGGALVVPIGLMQRLKGEIRDEPAMFARQTQHVERLAMEAVLATERRLGREPRDVSGENLGYDVESKIPGAGRLFFIEVKGRAAGATTVTITRNEVLTALNKPDEFILALVEVDGDNAKEPVYVRRPFQKEPDFGVTSVNYELKELLRRGEAPS